MFLQALVEIYDVYLRSGRRTHTEGKEGLDHDMVGRRVQNSREGQKLDQIACNDDLLTADHVA